MSYQSRIPRIVAELAAKMDAGSRAAAELIAARAKDRAPVRTGKLKNAIHVERERAGEHAVVAGDRDVFYGHIVEHGGAHSAARPFLVPALEESRDDAVALARGLMADL